MNCTEFRRRLSETLDGGRGDDDLSRHVESCPACASVRARYLSLSGALSTLSVRRPGAGFNASVLAALAPSPAPVTPLLLSAAVSSTVVALGASRMTVAPIALAAGTASLWADFRVFGRAASFFLPAPRVGAEFAAAALMAAALFFVMSLPYAVSTRRPLGAKL